MKHKLLIFTLLFLTNRVSAQTYDGLQKLDKVTQAVYFSNNARERAVKILANVATAETYFEKHLKVHPNYTLLVLSPSDWKKFAHPNAIYGIPHYLPDGRLVVASENNNFWKRNTPPLDKIPKELAKQLKDAYSDNNGEIALTDFFDLLAVHELGHAFQLAAGMKMQRSWLNELLCNVLLHTFIAENNAKLLPALTVFPKVTVAGFPQERLTYTKLEDFETNYNDLAQNHPDNYGWYQCRFHSLAGQIYDSGGVATMTNLWGALLIPKSKLNDKELAGVLHKAHPAFEQAIANWDKKL
ncbi:MAG: hypothetical protein WKF66_04040 [Pedobacter sp.]